MITYKPKNKLSKQFPYRYLVLILLLLGGIAAFAIYSGQNNETATTNAEPPVITMANLVDISGEWVGTGTEDYGIENRYDLRLTITQDGNTITGKQYMVTSNYEPEIYAISQISGTVNGEDFTYTENKILELDNISPDYWCLASVTLNYEVIGGQETLIGTWGSGEPDRAECQGITGRVLLTRNK